MSAPSPDSKRYWFPAKRFGWGWGPPKVWQGWFVLAVFFILLLVGASVFLPKLRTLAFLAYTAFLVAVLIGICWIKGERPRWRWGDDT
jgi:drug/metabolite transporter (DMT)-like permease